MTRTHADDANASTHLINGLRSLGYREGLLEENYAFPDWFKQQRERVTVAAAFGQTPVSYDSACIGIIRAGHHSGAALVDQFRALGAPILLEIDHDEVREWEVSRVEGQHVLTNSFRTDRIPETLATRAQWWQPIPLLRAKNISSSGWERQFSLFSGLLPELESHIQAQLDPLLRQTLAETSATYVSATGREPQPEQLFKTVFWLLTAKVFRDRKVPGFVSLTDEADTLLAAVAKHYRLQAPRLLVREARQIAAQLIWRDLDFRNLSVEVLSQIWSTTLVDAETRQRLGIHRTSRTLVRYIVERIPFTPTGDDKRIVFEPCCGSAAFLIGAMHTLRQSIFGLSAVERHRYFVDHLTGIEFDPFGTEISTLALTLADFPNPNGWKIETSDVFIPGAMKDHLRRAGVVLCNPPFEDFSAKHRALYKASSPCKPAELLNRVLDDLHPSGVLGFVLPAVAVDGRSYASVRERLAQRFASLEFTALPDRAFVADTEVALLVATEPIPHDVSRVTYRHVKDDAASWAAFSSEHRVTAEHSQNFGVQQANVGFRIPDLPEVWNFLRHHETLAEVADVHRGIEWTLSLADNLDHLVKAKPTRDFRRGVPPKAKFNVFQSPTLAYLNFSPELQRTNAWKLDWSKPKAILNKSTKSRGQWRIAASADRDGVPCYQTFVGVWPTTTNYDEVLLAAVLNAPVANAFVATREGKTDITLETLRRIPMPVFLEEQRKQLRALVERYERASAPPLLGGHPNAGDPERILKEIDAVVLDGYRMPPRLERLLLDFFRGERRPVAHQFADYFPTDFDLFLPLSEYLDPNTAKASVGAMLELIGSR